MLTPGLSPGPSPSRFGGGPGGGGRPGIEVRIGKGAGEGDRTLIESQIDPTQPTLTALWNQPHLRAVYFGWRT